MKRNISSFLSAFNEKIELSADKFVLLGADESVRYYISDVIGKIKLWKLKYVTVDTIDMWKDLDWQITNGFEGNDIVPVYKLNNKIDSVIDINYPCIITGEEKHDKLVAWGSKDGVYINCELGDTFAWDGGKAVCGMAKVYGMELPIADADKILQVAGTSFWLIWNILQSVSLLGSLDKLDLYSYKELGNGNMFELFSRVRFGKFREVITFNSESEGLSLISFLDNCYTKLAIVFKMKHIQLSFLGSILEINNWIMKKYGNLSEGLKEAYFKDVYTILMGYKRKMYNQLYDVSLLSKIMLVELSDLANKDN